MKKPEQLNVVDLVKLRELCQSYIDYLDSEDYSEDNDYDHYIFEEAMNALYGPSVWGYVNSKMK